MTDDLLRSTGSGAALDPAALVHQSDTPVDRTWRSRAKDALRTLGWPGGIIAVFVLLAVFGPMLAPLDPNALNASAVSVRPFQDSAHFLGTDQLGRDILSRTLQGARLSFVIAIVPVTVGGVIGVILGALAGLGPRVGGTVVMRLTDIALAFPSIMLALAVVAVRGPSFSSAVIALTLVFIAPMARVARGAAVEVASRPYMDAARLTGAGLVRRVRDFALPNMLGQILVFAAASCGGLLVFGAGLSFLGAGARAPDVEWGLMVADGRSEFLIDPWPSIAAGIPIFIVSVGFNCLADRLRDRLDPRRLDVGGV